MSTVLTSQIGILHQNQYSKQPYASTLACSDEFSMNREHIQQKCGTTGVPEPKQPTHSDVIAGSLSQISGSNARIGWEETCFCLPSALPFAEEPLGEAVGELAFGIVFFYELQEPRKGISVQPRHICFVKALAELP